MISDIAGAPRLRHAYNHRLREQVVCSGVRSLTRHVVIPCSTESTWQRRGPRPVLTIEPLHQDRQQLLDAIGKLDRRAQILAAVVPHSAFSGQTPDDMYFGTAANLLDELDSARARARARHLEANRAMSCARCIGRPVDIPAPEIPPRFPL